MGVGVSDRLACLAFMFNYEIDLFSAQILSWFFVIAAYFRYRYKWSHPQHLITCSLVH